MRYIYIGDGERLDTYLSNTLTDKTRSYIKKLIDNGDVRVNDVNVKAGYALKNTDIIDVEIKPSILPNVMPENIPLDIVYQDKDIVVINKAYGMVVHPCDTMPSGTMVNALMYHIDDLSGINGVLRAGIVHRLDKDTSGLIVVAKNDKAHAALSAQLLDKTMYREYYAILNGNIKDSEMVIDTAIARSKKDRKKMEVPIDGNGRNAVSTFTVLDRYMRHTLVSVRLKTGRTHQIRVHSKHINHPIIGDPIYGSSNDKCNTLMLVSKVLSFIHPTTNERVKYEIELPEYFRKYLKSIENTKI